MLMLMLTLTMAIASLQLITFFDADGHYDYYAMMPPLRQRCHYIFTMMAITLRHLRHINDC